MVGFPRVLQRPCHPCEEFKGSAPVRSCPCNSAHDRLSSHWGIDCRCCDARGSPRRMCASTTFGMAWESAGGTGWPAGTEDIHIATRASRAVLQYWFAQFRAGITCKPRPGVRLFVRGAAGTSLRAIRLGDFLPRTIVFHMPHGVWRRLCRGNRRPPTRNRRHPMRTLLPHAATAAVLATAVAISTPRGLAFGAGTRRGSDRDPSCRGCTDLPLQVRRRRQAHLAIP